MSQISLEQTYETANRLQGFGGTVRGVGIVAIKPIVFGYDTTRHAIDVIDPEQLLRNIGGMVGAALGLRDGAHPRQIEGRPARIEIFTQVDAKNKDNG